MYAYVATWKIYPKKTGKMYTVRDSKNYFVCFVTFIYFSYIISLAWLGLFFFIVYLFKNVQHIWHEIVLHIHCCLCEAQSAFYKAIFCCWKKKQKYKRRRRKKWSAKSRKMFLSILPLFCFHNKFLCLFFPASSHLFAASSI